MPRSPKLSLLALQAIAALSLAAETASAGDEPFIGEILTVPYTFCPYGTVEANGQLLSIAEYDALFALIGTTFGGDGQVTFAVPNLASRIPTGTSTQIALGQQIGQETVTLNASQMAAHSHTVNASNADGNLAGPGNKVLAAAPTNGTGTETIYSDQPANTTMSSAMIGQTGGSQPFSVVDPYVVARYCIAVFGIFPSRP